MKAETATLLGVVLGAGISGAAAILSAAVARKGTREQWELEAAERDRTRLHADRLAAYTRFLSTAQRLHADVGLRYLGTDLGPDERLLAIDLLEAVAAASLLAGRQRTRDAIDALAVAVVSTGAALVGEKPHPEAKPYDEALSVFLDAAAADLAFSDDDLPLAMRRPARRRRHGKRLRG